MTTSTINDFIDALSTEPSTGERGTKFGELMVFCVTLNPVLPNQYSTWASTCG